MNPIGDAAAVDDLARIYRREAQRIERAANESLRYLQRIITHRWWQGNRATRTLHAVTNDRRTITAQAHELRSIATALEHHADWIRQTISELENLESRIRRWAELNPPNPETPLPDATLITYWPPYCSPEWRNLHQRLRSHGAHP